MKNKLALLSSSMLLSFTLAACSSDASTSHPVASATSTSSPIPTASEATKAPSQQSKSAHSQSAQANRLSATILSVTDGDTMKIKVNGKNETVRLLLVDTPETKHPNKPVQPFGPEASAFAKKTLEGKNVQIEMDVSERDKYGRLLVYLWVDGKMFNEMLLEKGLARVAYVYPPNVKYVDPFREIQKKAQIAGLGIWSIENYVQKDGFHPDKVKKTQPTIPAPVHTQSPTASSSNIQYKNCTDARAAGVTPIYEGQPGYSRKLDRDGDGVACE
ncbi:thermonuclease family protein [Aneurinibacillus aneurinilyticus]|jgi:micrococcal nuclease|uniref:thermonuclease family protein n=1 Tax=Aneurinibacillus aneurinilyticus TaxID=1391 RepID=UPI0023FA0339|nr:thermonuclease family protein [Aneurinibacillus aneurinilyticus]MCI1694749.1 thermonuclease family protein [Aneurinibacillus aneurinilyticus]MED0672644.1 thermonuclease family protein [Aneurinibacillus aneurinilyticus]